VPSAEGTSCIKEKVLISSAITAATQAHVITLLKGGLYFLSNTVETVINIIQIASQIKCGNVYIVITPS
jgi:hypothetical protein